MESESVNMTDSDSDRSFRISNFWDWSNVRTAGQIGTEKSPFDAYRSRKDDATGHELIRATWRQVIRNKIGYVGVKIGNRISKSESESNF